MAAKSRHEHWLELKRAQERERAIQQAKDQHSRKWAINCAAVSALLSMRSLFAVCRAKLPLLKRIKYCTRVIIKAYRKFRVWRESERLQAEVRGGLCLHVAVLLCFCASVLLCFCASVLLCFCAAALRI
jgi:uncharacterized membrane protein